jgi:hypothetical protein
MKQNIPFSLFFVLCKISHPKKTLMVKPGYRHTKPIKAFPLIITFKGNASHNVLYNIAGK